MTIQQLHRIIGDYMFLLLLDEHKIIVYAE